MEGANVVGLGNGGEMIWMMKLVFKACVKAGEE